MAKLFADGLYHEICLTINKIKSAEDSSWFVSSS